MLSIIIPVHNGQRSIAKTLEDYRLYFTSEYDGDFEIVVIPNGCTDETTRIVNKYLVNFPHQVHSSEFKDRMGKGGAVIEGFKMARGDVVAFVDADGAVGPGELHKLIIELQDVDGVIGSKWACGSKPLVSQPIHRRIAGRGFNLLVRLMFDLPFKDTQCGAKVFRKRAIDRVLPQLQVRNFAFDVELLHRLKKSGYKLKEVPVTWEDKDASSVNMRKVIPGMFLSVARLRLSTSASERFATKRVWYYMHNSIWGNVYNRLR